VILFCDTSALVKLFVQEQHSDTLREAAQSCSHLVVSELTWVEMCSALGLKQRTRQIDVPQSNQALQSLRAQWPGYFKLGVDPTLLGNAGELALAFGLRAYDSVQLASVQQAHQHTGNALVFACFDQQLSRAAMALGISTLKTAYT
jgi:predicted nucleic acid-binding protein